MVYLPENYLSKHRIAAVSPSWSHLEVEATVESYFQMLEAELRGEAYSKTEHRRRLLPLLQSRTEGAVELKHGNISAILIELGFPYISGYKPYRNYQDLLREVVIERLSGRPRIGKLAEEDAERHTTAILFKDILKSLTEPPKPYVRKEKVADHGTAYRPIIPWQNVNYLEKEARNAKLGRAGEEFVIMFEQARLRRSGKLTLAEKVEHISLSRGDGEGFDVLSFEESGEERLIEVKTTKYGRETPFFVTRREVEASHHFRNDYHLYRVFEFRETAKLYTLKGAIPDNCELEATSYIARVG